MEAPLTLLALKKHKHFQQPYNKSNSAPANLFIKFQKVMEKSVEKIIYEFLEFLEEKKYLNWKFKF